jgi:hypothetical protein
VSMSALEYWTERFGWRRIGRRDFCKRASTNAAMEILIKLGFGPDRNPNYSDHEKELAATLDAFAATRDTPPPIRERHRRLGEYPRQLGEERHEQGK